MSDAVGGMLLVGISMACGFTLSASLSPTIQQQVAMKERAENAEAALALAEAKFLGIGMRLGCDAPEPRK